jgi:hypothetical protein
MADTRITNLRQSLPQRVRAALIGDIIESARKESKSLTPADRIRFSLMAGQMHRDLYIDRHRDLCKLMGVEPEINKASNSRDWRAASERMFGSNHVAMMVAMTLMHCYHVGGFSTGNPDPLKPFLGVYKIDAKAVAKKVKAEVDAKVAEIQASINKRKAKAAA